MYDSRPNFWLGALNVVFATILIATQYIYAQEVQTGASLQKRLTLINVIPVNDDDFIGKPTGSFSGDNEVLVTITNNQGSLGQGGGVRLWSIREARNLCRWETYGKEINGYYEGDYPIRVEFLPESNSEFVVYTSCSSPGNSCKVQWSVEKCGQEMPKAKLANIQYALSDSEDDSGERTTFDMLTNTFAIGYSIDKSGCFHDYSIYNMLSGERVAKLVDSLTSRFGTAISTDGRYVLTSGQSSMGRAHRDSVMYVFETRQSRVLSEIGLRSNFTALCSSDAVLAAYDDRTRQTVIFDLVTGREVQSLGEQSGRPLLFSDDGALLATISERGICLWAK